MNRLWIGLLTLALSGCAGFVGEITTASPDELRKYSSEQLAWAYGSDWKFWGKKNRNIRAELTDRNTFSPEEWKLIDARKIRERCHQDVVMAAWGPPTNQDVTVLGGVKSEVWRYGYYGSGPIKLVYIANSHVIGWSELK